LFRKGTLGLLDEAGVGRIDEIHAHRFGPYQVADIVICIDGSLNKMYIRTHPVNS